LYKATTFGFSCRQGLHQDAQKSIMVTLPKLCLSEIIFPSGLFAEKLGACLPASPHLVAGAGVAGSAEASGLIPGVAIAGAAGAGFLI
jgi:hypothetical protein